MDTDGDGVMESDGDGVIDMDGVMTRMVMV